MGMKMNLDTIQMKKTWIGPFQDGGKSNIQGRKNIF